MEVALVVEEVEEEVVQVEVGLLMGTEQGQMEEGEGEGVQVVLV